MTTAELEFRLENAAEAMASPLRGQAGRFPARHLSAHLRRQGFLVTRHFLDRLLERAQAQGVRFDPRTFSHAFRAAPHFRQTRPGYNTRFALMHGLPVLDRMGGRRGVNPVLVGLLPQGALPPAAPVAAPLVHEGELKQELEMAALELSASQVVVSRFPPYSISFASLPAPEQEKIDRIARLIVRSLRSGRGSVRDIRLIGHADLDMPRRPAFEYEIALKRANEVLVALLRAINRVDRSAALATPPYSSRVAWKVYSAAASRLVVPNPRTEFDRSRNRRVEISLIPYGVSARRGLNITGAQFEFKPTDLSPRLRAIIDDFLQRAPNDTRRKFDRKGRDLGPDRSVCVRAVAEKAMQLCRTANAADRDVPCNPPLTLTKGRCLAETRGIKILDGKDYRSPIAAPIRCCNISESCQVPLNQDCAHCRLGTLPPGHYLVLKYKAKPLAQMVENLKCLLDRGCVTPVGVLSGICDDKPDMTCPAKPKDRWRDCWEHWLLVLGYEGAKFVFWDSSAASVIGPEKAANGKDSHWFGILHYDSKNDRFSTANPDPSIDGLEVNADGTHTQGLVRGNWFQRRYQVVSMWPGLPWKTRGSSCSLGKT